MVIFRLQRLLSQRVAGIGVKACRYSNHVWLEILEVVQRAVEHVPVIAAGGLRRDGIIEAVVSNITPASSRITGELMNGNERGIGFVQQDGLSSVAMVNVEIIDRDTFR